MQRSSTKLRPVEEQIPLIARPPIESQPVSLERIGILSNTKEALWYACELARLVPKEIYGEMEIAKSTWSRIVSGEWDLDGRDIRKFNSVVGNNAYLLYLMYEDGVDLTTVRKVATNDLERENAELRKELAEHKYAMRLFVEAAQGKGGA